MSGSPSRSGRCRASVADAVHGVVLAGGRGRRMGGEKTTALLFGRPLLMAPIEAMLRAGLQVSVVAKASTPLPDLGPIRIVREPDVPTHPLVGIRHALEVIGDPVVVCAGDMPFVPSALFQCLATSDAPVVVVATADGTQPLLGRYSREVIATMDDAIASGMSMRAFIAALGVQAQVLGPDELSRFGDPDRITSDVDTPQQLHAAHGV